MFQSEIFDEVAEAFGRPFTEAEILSALSTRADWVQSAGYCHSLLKDRVNKTKLIFDGTHFSVNAAYVSSHAHHADGVAAASLIAGLPPTWSYTDRDGYRVPFSPLALSPEEAFKFFVHTVRYYLRLIDENRRASLKPGIVLPAGTSLEKLYLSPTDRILLNPNGTLSDDSLVFKGMVFHTQNRQGGIDFLGKEAQMYTYLRHYDIEAFYRYIYPKNEAIEVPIIRSMLSVSETQASDFFKSVKSIANYLYAKKTAVPAASVRDGVINDFAGLMPRYLRIYYAMRRPPISIYGLGEALTFDFLKELDPIFDLPKPDKHVKRTMVSLLHLDRANMYRLSGLSATGRISSPAKVDENAIQVILGPNNCMELYLDLMRDINQQFATKLAERGLPPEQIKNYVLDKMIYMVCSGKLYLQVPSGNSKKAIKDEYKSKILSDEYKRITVDQADIDNILSLI